jgi:tetratricopeptide (TPR) repeat protein
MKIVHSVVIVICLIGMTACRGTKVAGHDHSAFDADAAIANVNKQLKHSPNSSDLHGQLALLAGVRKDWVTFDREIETAIRLDPDLMTNYINAAEIYRMRGRTDMAVQMLKTAIARDPQNPLTHFFLATFYEHTPDRANALLEYQEAKRLNEVLRASGRTGKLSDGHEVYYDKSGQPYYLPSDSEITKSVKRLESPKSVPSQN